MGHPNLTIYRYEHWTEHDDRVLAYLHKAFGVDPVRPEEGADWLCGDVRIEVKACREWIKKTRCNGSTAVRRRGRFKIEGYEDADFFLFVIELSSDELLITMLDAPTFFDRFGFAVRTVVWPLIFLKPPPPGTAFFPPLRVNDGGYTWRRDPARDCHPCPV
jgi:hypothetical protein